MGVLPVLPYLAVNVRGLCWMKKDIGFLDSSEAAPRSGVVVVVVVVTVFLPTPCVCDIVHRIMYIIHCTLYNIYMYMYRRLQMYMKSPL